MIQLTGDNLDRAFSECHDYFWSTLELSHNAFDVDHSDPEEVKRIHCAASLLEAAYYNLTMVYKYIGGVNGFITPKNIISGNVCSATVINVLIDLIFTADKVAHKSGKDNKYIREALYEVLYLKSHIEIDPTNNVSIIPVTKHLLVCLEYIKEYCTNKHHEISLNMLSFCAENEDLTNTRPIYQHIIEHSKTL